MRSFTFWLYLFNLVPLFLLGLIGLLIALASSGLVNNIGQYAFWVPFVSFFLIAISRAAFGFGIAKLNCPFCGKTGRVWSPRRRLELHCPSCGTVRQAGFLGLRSSKVADMEKAN